MSGLDVKLKLPIYLDYHSTTPVDPRVLEKMVPFFLEDFGNAASRNHAYGWQAEGAVERARAQVASLIGASPKEIIFTSGATESNNLALIGAAEFLAESRGGKQSKSGGHIIVSCIEHKAVLDAAYFLQKQGFEVTFLPVENTGRVNIGVLEQAMRPDTVLVSIMAANNEIGTINPMQAIGALCKKRGVLFHTDAVQAIGKMVVDVQDWQVDLLSLTAHKIYGPKGVAALYVRRKNPRVRLAPRMFGGGHERGMRSGTLNVPGIVGFGEACALVEKNLDAEIAELSVLRDRLWKGISDRIDEVYINGHPEFRLVNNLNVSFAFIEGESMMMGMKELAVSSGSACTSASLEPSYVLKNIGVTEDLAHTSIRFSVGRFTTVAQIDYAIEKVCKTALKLRDLSPLYEMFKEGVDLKSVQWSAH